MKTNYFDGAFETKKVSEATSAQDQQATNCQQSTLVFIKCLLLSSQLFLSALSMSATLTSSGQIEYLSRLDDALLDPEVNVDDADDPMSPKYPLVLQLERDWLLRLEV